ncbi:argininosuccinate synthase [Flavonifractor plautii]|nr:argininosuccinate synthase [Flavonifractor plautii]
MKENYNDPEIIAVSGDVGQGAELDGLEEKAIKTGASKLYVEDLTDQMVDEVIIPSMMMGAKYEDYLLGTAFARPIIAKRLVEIAKQEGADAICHGCTGKGNDQVRFELAIKRFAPEMKIIAPLAGSGTSRAGTRRSTTPRPTTSPLKISRETSYSKDKNLWHLSHEGLDLEDPANEPQYDKPGFLEMGVSPAMAPDAPAYVTIDFEKGWPAAVDGVKMKASDLIRRLNELGGANGIGLLDIVENRLVGMKDRGVYETPGGTILYRAHEVLEQITLDKDTKHMKQKLAVDFADLVYNGKWFTPLREALTAFATDTQKYVTGTVKLKLYKGNLITASISSPLHPVLRGSGHLRGERLRPDGLPGLYQPVGPARQGPGPAGAGKALSGDPV